VEGSHAEAEADVALAVACDLFHLTVPTTLHRMLAMIEATEQGGLDSDHVLELVANGLRRMASA
jgi:hypothetical protein